MMQIWMFKACLHKNVLVLLLKKCGKSNLICFEEDLIVVYIIHTTNSYSWHFSGDIQQIYRHREDNLLQYCCIMSASISLWCLNLGYSKLKYMVGHKCRREIPDLIITPCIWHFHHGALIWGIWVLVDNVNNASGTKYVHIYVYICAIALGMLKLFTCK